jgi:hypothetical protein
LFFEECFLCVIFILELFISLSDLTTKVIFII